MMLLGSAVAFFFLAERVPFKPPMKPQTPTPPFDYEVREIAVENRDLDITLGGTLTIPNGDGPFPAVILLSVAGPNDRNQAFAGHVGFHVLADHLTRGGIAVARFDDRGIGASTGDYFASSWDDLSTDALAVGASLQAESKISSDAIGFLGMSQGGAVGALATLANKNVSFLILVSAPGLPGEEALKQQLETTLSLSSISGPRAENYRNLFAEFIDIVKSDPSDPSTRERMVEFLEGPGRALVPPYQFVPKDLEGRVDMFLSPWYRSNVLFDPAATYGSLNVPILVLGGSKDVVAPPKYHLANIEKILSDNFMSNVTAVTLPGANHLMQEAETGLPTEYASLENSFSPAALNEITRWIIEEHGSRKFGTR